MSFYRLIFLSLLYRHSFDRFLIVASIFFLKTPIELNKYMITQHTSRRTHHPHHLLTDIATRKVQVRLHLYHPQKYHHQHQHEDVLLNQHQLIMRKSTYSGIFNCRVFLSVIFRELRLVVRVRVLLSVLESSWFLNQTKREVSLWPACTLALQAFANGREFDMWRIVIIFHGSEKYMLR